MGVGTSIPAYPLHVESPKSQATVLYAENTYVGNFDGTGVYGKSDNNPYFGIGVKGEGGFIGVDGIGSGGTNTASTYGVRGIASGSAGTRYGVIGRAVGGTTNYGVYCDGSGGYTGTWTLVSDRKFKQDVKPVASAMELINQLNPCLLYTSPSPRDKRQSRMPSSA